ncbi:MAG: hypothetical protein O2887_09800, partial [Bacteroidetes bacterium]|nr:hypothetical protein [Bacteroidota bacterium]
MKGFFMIFFYSFLSTSLLLAQPRADSLSKAMTGLYGKEKLILQHKLTQEYFKVKDYKKALQIAKQATALAEQIIVEGNDLVSPADSYLKPTTYFLMGKAFYFRSQFSYAREYFEMAINGSIALNSEDYVELSQRYLETIEENYEVSDKKFF